MHDITLGCYLLNRVLWTLFYALYVCCCCCCCCWVVFFCIPLSSSVYLVQQFNNINQGVLSLLEKLYEA